MQIKLTSHETKEKFVVNTPRTHVQRQPRTYGSLDRAMARVAELRAAHPDAEFKEDPR